MHLFRYSDPDGAIHIGRLHPDGSRERLEGEPWIGSEALRPSGEAAAVARLLAPLEPRAILCIGVNYRRHALEFGSAIPERPVLFMKAPGAVQHPGAPIELPTVLASSQVDYEGELAVVIGRPCRDVPEAKATLKRGVAALLAAADPRPEAAARNTTTPANAGKEGPKA